MTPKEIFEYVQPLRKVMQMLSTHRLVPLEKRMILTQLDYGIEHIAEHNVCKQFTICIDITDFDNPLEPTGGQTVHWREWSLVYNYNRFEMFARSHIIEEPLSFADAHPNIYINIPMPSYTKSSLIINASIEEFVADILKFESYINDEINCLEIEIDAY
jgi:hypothetical protein